MTLSKHFTFDELTVTTHADLVHRNVIEANQYLANLRELAENLLDPIREKFGPFTVSSGFRGPSLNLRVGGSKTSQHCLGQAADICRTDWAWEALDGVANWITKESGIKFGQVIREKHGGVCWIHVSTGEKCQALDFVDGVYTHRV